MVRVGLRLLAASVVLFLVGFASLASVWFEVVRLVGVGCLVAGMALLLVHHLRTPDPGEK
jgi:hypothetical protein